MQPGVANDNGFFVGAAKAKTTYLEQPLNSWLECGQSDSILVTLTESSAQPTVHIVCHAFFSYICPVCDRFSEVQTQ